MNLGVFSLSLTVKNLTASRDFYQKLGFTVFHGELEQNWLIMKNGETVIGLFQGMFPDNILCFNPGWDHNGKPVDPFTDVRDIQSQLQKSGLDAGDAIDSKEGPASFMVTDPDGNTILIDQHR
jgi:catechol 2,3-dioxygenase-like lactoylglutathione lyase family enzyme